MRIAVKYCGNCNPHIDVPRLAEEFKNKLVLNDLKAVVLSPGAGEIDLILMVSGCLNACVDRPTTRDKAPKCLLVAGQTLDYLPVREEDLPNLLIQKVKEWFG